MKPSPRKNRGLAVSDLLAFEMRGAQHEEELVAILLGLGQLTAQLRVLDRERMEGRKQEATVSSSSTLGSNRPIQTNSFFAGGQDSGLAPERDLVDELAVAIAPGSNDGPQRDACGARGLYGGSFKSPAHQSLTTGAESALKLTRPEEQEMNAMLAGTALPWNDSSLSPNLAVTVPSLPMSI